MKSISYDKIKITDQLWSERLETAISKTLHDVFENCYSQGRVENFLVAAGKSDGEITGMCYDDADVYKLIEGMSYALVSATEVESEWINAELPKLVKIVVDAQEEDGYLHTMFTTRNANRWEDMDAHEMFNAGSLIEAGCAHYGATGDKDLLDAGIKFADHIINRFVEGDDTWVPGHQEIELAMVRLSILTGEEKYMNAAHYLLETRGHGIGLSSRNFNAEKWAQMGEEYYLDLMPVKDLEHIMGHAVRAIYTIIGMIDVHSEIDEYGPAILRVWDNLVNKNIYITGGIGAAQINEGFAGDYYLPNDTAYCETCAAVVLSQLAKRMNDKYGDLKSLEVIEMILHNNALSGISLSGTEYFYDNPLESSKNHERSEWFETSCCPTQVARFFPQIGGFIYSEDEKRININQLIGSNYGDKVMMDVNYDDEIITVNVQTDKVVYFRVPNYMVLRTNEYTLEKGYIKLKKGSNIIKYCTQIEFHIAKNDIEADRGKISVSYGPFVLCTESDEPINASLSRLQPKKVVLEEINGFKYPVVWVGEIKLIPYFLWNNNGPKYMKVWFEDADINNIYR